MYLIRAHTEKLAVEYLQHPPLCDVEATATTLFERAFGPPCEEIFVTLEEVSDGYRFRVAE